MKTIFLNLSLLLTLSSFAQWSKVKEGAFYSTLEMPEQLPESAAMRCGEIDPLAFYECSAVTENICYASNYKALWKTTDGGFSWSNIRPQSQDYYHRTKFISEKVGYLFEGAGFYKTMDGGESWIKIEAPEGMYLDGFNMKVMNENLIYFPGNVEYEYIKTTDGGKTFSTMKVPYPPNFSSIHFFDDKKGVISTTEYVVNPGELNYLIERINYTNDGGKNWLTTYVDRAYCDSEGGLDFAFSKSIYKIKFINELIGYAISGKNTILKSSDGGLHWAKIGKLPIEDLNCNDFPGVYQLVITDVSNGNSNIQRLVIVN